MDDEMNSEIARSLLDQGAGVKGIRKLCIDSKRCGLGMCCEHALNRGQTVELVSAWTTHKVGDCGNYFPRTELGSEGDVPRRISTPGRSRHNLHAPPREQERAKLLYSTRPSSARPKDPKPE